VSERIEKLKEAEDEVARIIDALPGWKQAIAYQYLHNVGLTIVDCPRLIREGLKKEEAKPAPTPFP